MGSVSISPYQIVNYFLSGFVVVFSGFLVYYPHPCGVSSHLGALKSIHFIIGFILSCLAGIVITALRNVLIEVLILEKLFSRINSKSKKREEILCTTCKKKLKKEENSLSYTINWNFFHKASKEKLEQAESSYYVFYSGSFNISIALFFSSILFSYGLYWPKNIIQDQWRFILLMDILAFILLIYAIFPLRRQMVRATNENRPIYAYKINSSIRYCLLRLFIILLIAGTTVYFNWHLYKKMNKLYVPKSMSCYCMEARDTIQKAESINKLDSLGVIGPFSPGTNSITAELQYKIKMIIDSLEKNQYSEIYIFGAVDKRLLKDTKQHGDNLTLAQARADAVKNEIENFYEGETKPVILTFPKGADHPGDPDKFYLDRCVTVYGRKIGKML